MKKVSSRDLAEHIFSVPPRLFHSVKDIMHSMDSEIPMSQIRVMKYIHHHKSTVNSLAENMLVTAPTMSATIDSLEIKKLVRRERSHEDRRVVLLSLTKEGLKVVNTLHEEIVRLIQSHIEELSQSEKNTIMEALLLLEKCFLLKCK